MEGEVREKDTRAQGRRSETEFIHGLSQEQSIFNNMQHNHQPESDRRRLSLENMSCTQLLAMAINTVATSSSIDAPLLKPQYDVSTPQKFLCDLNLTPEEMVSTSAQRTEPEFPPITLETPGKRLSETDEEPGDRIKKSVLETGSPSGVKKRKRATDDEKVQLGTPTLKRKKIRPKVVREGKTNRVSSKAGIKKSTVAAATASKTSEESTYVRPKRSTRRSIRLDFDFQEEDEEFCGLDFTSSGHVEGSSSGENLSDTTLGLFGNIPKGRRGQRRSNGFMEKVRFNPSSETDNDCFSSMLSLINTRPESFMESEEDRPSDSRISQSLGRQRSIIATRPRNFRSLKKLLQRIIPSKRDRKGRDKKGYKLPRGFPQLKAIFSKMQSTICRKKRSQPDRIASQFNARVLDLQWRRQNPTGTSLAEIWERSLTIDAITKLFEELDINKEGPCLPHNRETALILYKKAYAEQHAIVKYSKKQKPKVQLDPETSRVWKLLMLSIDSDGVDGLDEEKRKWWEDERNIFHGRANSFIARMRVVQGNRTFSPWKGSVVDSVVGVFLTQNVADHSSSSAYMDLAAEFPVDWNFNKGSCLEEWGSSVTHETVTNFDPRIGVSTPRIHNSTCVIIEEIDDDEDDIDAVCSQESSKTSDSSISSANQSKMMLLDPFNTVLMNEQVDSQMVKGKGHIPYTDDLNGLSEEISMVSSTSTHCELNLNEVPPEVELCSHQQEPESTIQSQDQQENTRTEDVKKNRKKPTTSKLKKKSKEPAKSNKKKSFDWDSLRKQAESGGRKRERTERTMDTVDWDALRCTDVNKIANIIIKRGMNNMLAERIKAFLNRLVRKHGSIDLEWLRDVPPDQAKEFLLSINGLGLKSVECVRLLSLHQIAFPVDTNVGRIAVRLGWVPLQPLPDELQMHLLELYPVLESVQKYLWPRLCKLDQKTLYELHYHMITFGKVFCTKVKPNCNACPMKAECRHYASARASARLALPEPEESDRTTVMVHERRYKRKPLVVNFRPSLFLFQEKEQEAQRSQNCEPIIEEPASPEPEYIEHDIEDYPWGNNNVGTSKDPWENKDVISTIMLNKEAGTSHDLVVNKEAGTSQDLVVLSTYAAAIPRRKLKIKERLRTEHNVYELPKYHSILEGFERHDDDDLVPYLLAICTPGEKEESHNTVRGTILIPCRTAMRGGFPLNGTYFQTNEVFADHGTSINPIEVPTQLIWYLRRRVAYFGSSVSSICKGLSVEQIEDNFQEGYVCVRGFDRENRKPKSLVKRLHCSHIAIRTKEKTEE
ncbi:Endonuclease III-like iron-sulfur cluster loop motif [Arabidopsis thaliana x Arabidopsis arenosa]|uniref:Endonuclease III-like iron-sulfur cluster loop motif n=1 Tax=Arabidopsis thaliana x Arabidopsis arenosa TaxID=1240361 RepID=A0A8T2ARD0_9BRAS|nr:Endonuclease III-like iron-sulfur cluster loop motif [Arabidopsis thaliana x Arabidopsis arenosa]